MRHGSYPVRAFDCVVSTAEAIERLAFESYDLVITDLGRTESSDRRPTAGKAFLEQPAVRDGGPPVIVKAGFPNHVTTRGRRVAGVFSTRESLPLYLVGERCSP